MSADDNHVPASHDQYLPTIVGDIKGVVIDTKDARYISATKAAFFAGLSQNQFGRMLAIEAERVIAAQARAKPAAETVAQAAPAERKTIPGYASMSMREKLVASGNI